MQGCLTNKDIRNKRGDRMKEERKLLLEFTERERMYYYSLADFFAKSFPFSIAKE